MHQTRYHLPNFSPFTSDNKTFDKKQQIYKCLGNLTKQGFFSLQNRQGVFFLVRSNVVWRPLRFLAFALLMWCAKTILDFFLLWCVKNILKFCCYEVMRFSAILRCKNHELLHLIYYLDKFLRLTRKKINLRAQNGCSEGPGKGINILSVHVVREKKASETRLTPLSEYEPR